jgi:pimeloyl-ACP methyl ester carboxylesterase
MPAMQDPVRRLIHIEGVDLHWAEAGQGRPMVLLHGLSDSHRTWGKIAPALARHHRVLMPDLPGHGLSSRPDASYTVAWHAHVMTKWLEALGLDQVDLVGHSFGGGVAQWLLLQQRERIRRLALVAPGGFGREVSLAIRLGSLPWVVEHLGQAVMAPATRLGIRSARAGFDTSEIEALAWMNSMPKTARALSRTLRDAVNLRGQRHHFMTMAEQLGELPPLALYWGDRDRVIPGHQADEAADFIEGVRIARFERCGHFPHREQAEAFTRELIAFVDEPTHAPARIRFRVVCVPVPRRARLRGLWHRAIARIGRIFRRRPRPFPRLGV